MAVPFDGDVNSASIACRGFGFRGPPSAASALRDPGPDNRTTAIPARPGGVESANIVSESVIDLTR